jgi:hypothetical protein
MTNSQPHPSVPLGLIEHYERMCRILDIVVPVKAGTQWRPSKKMLGSRFRGNDASFAEAVTHFGNPQ